MRNRSIGIFDSGFGGLHILRRIAKELPDHDFVYLGDTARTPYGTRSMEVVYEFTKQAVDFLFAKNCGLIVLACNTASSRALRKIQRKYLPVKYPGKRVLGVIIPAAESAVTFTRTKRIGVIATEGTVASRTFVGELLKLEPGLKVFQQACPLLVPIIEAGEERSKATDLILKNYLKPLIAKKIDTLILGCTHYGILEAKIKKIMGRNVRIVSEGEIVAEKLADYLKRHPEIESTLKKTGSRQFYSTDLTRKFQVLGSRFFGRPIKVKKALLGPH